MASNVEPVSKSGTNSPGKPSKTVVDEASTVLYLNNFLRAATFTISGLDDLTRTDEKAP